MDLKAIEAKLKAPFPESDVQWRIFRCGVSNGKPWAKVLAYIDARAIQDRLDEVFGIQNWSIEYQHTGGGVMCGITVNIHGIPNIECWVIKWDGADATDIEPFKGGISSAMKRAASAWGIGRYLYNLEEAFAEVSKERVDGAHHHKDGKGNEFYWKPPKLPRWALPGNEPSTNVAKEPDRRAGTTAELPSAETPRAAGTHPSSDEPNGNPDLIPAGQYKGRNPWEINENELTNYLNRILETADLSNLRPEQKATITIIGARLGRTIKFNKADSYDSPEHELYSMYVRKLIT
jgi:hypothetical protein